MARNIPNIICLILTIISTILITTIWLRVVPRIWEIILPFTYFGTLLECLAPKWLHAYLKENVCRFILASSYLVICFGQIFQHFVFGDITNNPTALFWISLGRILLGFLALFTCLTYAYQELKEQENERAAASRYVRHMENGLSPDPLEPPPPYPDDGRPPPYDAGPPPPYPDDGRTLPYPDDIPPPPYDSLFSNLAH